MSHTASDIAAEIQLRQPAVDGLAPARFPVWRVMIVVRQVRGLDQQRGARVRLVVL